MARLEGFLLKENGTALDSVIIGLTIIDDKGGSSGITGDIPFSGGTAVAPTNALFEPGQMRLFTIRAIIDRNVSAALGTQVKIEVAGIKSTATAKGQFPIFGTVWTIAQ